MWWIRASIQEYILRSWSLVKMGTTAAEEAVLQLAQGQEQDQALDDGDLRPEHVKIIAEQIGVTEQDVI